MTTHDLLFIRACKSRNPRQRVNSVYKRRYCRLIEDNRPYIVSIIAGVIERNFPQPDLSNVIGELKPDWLYKEDDFYDRCLRYLINTIRFAEVKHIDGFIPPAMFRIEATQ